MKIDFEELEFDPTTPTYTVTASYKGEPFTGTAFFVDENWGTYYERPYKNGKAHGRWFGINTRTGILVYEENYAEGNSDDRKEWFENRLPRLHAISGNGQLLFFKRWNDHEILIKHFDLSEKIDSEYYDNGSTYFEASPQKTESGYIKIYYDTKGRWLKKETLGTKMDIVESVFNDEDLSECLYELDSVFHYDIIITFIRHLREKNETLAVEFLLKLLNHTESAFKAEAMVRLGQMKVNTAIPGLKDYLGDKTSPSRSTRFDGNMKCNIYTLGELAQRNIDFILNDKESSS